jgi:hypothetical protein
MDDLDEFCQLIGKNNCAYRECQACGDLCIIDPDHYDKPMYACDPEDSCTLQNPYCKCIDMVMFDMEEIRACSYPNCNHEEICTTSNYSFDFEDDYPDDPEPSGS